MKNYNLIADNFKLEIEIEIFKKDIEIPTNSILNVKIDSDNFTAITTMDIDLNSFKKFARELLNIYDSLDGSVILKENYGDNYIEAIKLKNKKGYDIDIVPVETFDDALAYLKKM